MTMPDPVRSPAAMAGYADPHDLICDAIIALLSANSEADLAKAEKTFVRAVETQLDHRAKRALGMAHDTRLALLLLRRM